ncbi:MAG: hypothetical protein C5S40_00160 [ANME-2 cluster archaeon]|nr:hypothetical protein [ANME-2 cluster archaeon]
MAIATFIIQGVIIHNDKDTHNMFHVADRIQVEAGILLILEPVAIINDLEIPGFGETAY